MEQAHRVYGVGSPELRAFGKRNLDWDMNDWRWDGDLFLASHSHPQGQQFIPIEAVNGNSSNSSSSCSDEVHIDLRGKELERKRRVVVLGEDGVEDEEGNLTLKLGGFPLAENGVGNMEGIGGKKAKVGGSSSSRAVCQVDDCRADLSSAKDYHRRHKVCDIHSKAGKALVRNLMQRFCQQCSRFHLLHEFDEGKRSCRRRLAGHNKRRRKTQPEPANNEQASGDVLINLLKMLSSIHSNSRSDQTTDQDVVTHLLKSLAGQSSSPGGKDIPGLLHESQKLLVGGLPIGNSEMPPSSLSRLLPPRPTQQYHTSCASELPMTSLQVTGNGLRKGQLSSSQKPANVSPKDSPPAHSEVQDSSVRRAKLNNFDLNDIYIDSDDGVEDLERSPVAGNSGTGSLECPSWIQQESQLSSPPHVSGNSDSASAQSPSTSSGEAQSRTDQIVFKLFGKEPNEFPFILRAQMLDWLAHSPTEIESYIRPGCIVLTVYLRLSESIWEELSSDLCSSLPQLFDISNGSFWSTGWICTMVPHRMAFAYDGLVVMDAEIPDDHRIFSRISSVKPIAVSISEHAEFQIRGFKLSRPTTRLHCALEGRYLVQEASKEMRQDADSPLEKEEIDCITLSCSIPAVTGRGFIEVEDHGLSSSFFPFIVAEKDVCYEIRTLESILEMTGMGQVASIEYGRSEAKREALNFINEIGWLLHRSQRKSRLGPHDPSDKAFSFKRFKWIMEYSMDHDWCAVVKKLLDILLEGTVGSEEHPSLKVALSEMGLLHRAVRRNSKPLVELLLRYVPVRISKGFGYEVTSVSSKSCQNFLFRPDAPGPAGLTPLHIAAGRDGSDDVLDALTDDPEKIGIETWKESRDSTGSTPEDYARLRGHYTYIHLVQKKINKRSLGVSVMLDIQDGLSEISFDPKHPVVENTSLEIEKNETRATPRNCKLCVNRRVDAHGSSRRSMVYRPAMLSMVAIASVCVCVALLFKSLPEVSCVFEPFRWESLDYGSS